jgi:oligosaccharide repeat unit polymerase
MLILILSAVTIIILLLSKYLFVKWFNPLSLYAMIWYVMIFFYELRLINYVEIDFFTWVVIFSAYISFLLGIISCYSMKGYFKQRKEATLHNKVDFLYQDGGSRLKTFILVCALVGLFSAIQHWLVLIEMFGSIPMVLIQANLVYQMRTDNEIAGVIPYLHIIAYVGIFFGGIYTAFKGKITIIALLPFLAIVIKEIANVSRAGMLFGLCLYVTSFIIVRYSITRESRKKRSKLVFSILILITIFILAAGLVRSTRGTYESFASSSRGLDKFKSGFFITPSLYLYASSHIVVLSKYFKDDYDNTAVIGAYTFEPIYNLVSKFGVVKHSNFYEKGYLIPIWSNTSTYLRYIYSDWGAAGLFIFPFLLGFFSTFQWYLYFQSKNIYSLVILVFLMLVIAFSFLTLVMRLAIWPMSLLFILLSVPVLKILINKHLRLES